MISYEVYKTLHIFFIIVMVMGVAMGFALDNPSKKIKITCGVASFFILVGGMGLLARLGVNHGEGFPTWIKVKIAIWLAVAALTPILMKRLKANRMVGAYSIGALVTLAVIVAVYQPFS